MRCRVNFQSDPISLTIIAGDGKEHGLLEEIGDGNFIEIDVHNLCINDTERIDWLEKQDCYSVISDDGGRWACVSDGIQNIPESDPTDIDTTFFIEAADWHKNIRDAIDYAIEHEADDKTCRTINDQSQTSTKPSIKNSG